MWPPFAYIGAKGDVGRYKCDATRSNPEGDPCVSFGALRVDEAVGAEIVRLLQPLGVEAAIQAIAQREHQSGEKQRQIELALEQARYEATGARRQYDTIDPRIVWSVELIRACARRPTRPLRDYSTGRESGQVNRMVSSVCGASVTRTASRSTGMANGPSAANAR
ncbi:hypothetical protein NKJ10_30580 [Mesorhizobium sp. M0204]|uniref:hypothetical protein n=1 Tax=Mesorhizobium sp. M0204 TaxID=2956913 RepID=UPI003336F0DE